MMERHDHTRADTMARHASIRRHGAQLAARTAIRYPLEYSLHYGFSQPVFDIASYQTGRAQRFVRIGHMGNRV